MSEANGGGGSRSHSGGSSDNDTRLTATAMVCVATLLALLVGSCSYERIKEQELSLRMAEKNYCQTGVSAACSYNSGKTCTWIVWQPCDRKVKVE